MVVGDDKLSDRDVSASSTSVLFGMSSEELVRVMEGLGQPKYRAAQLGDALYKQRVGTLEEITTLPVGLREELAAQGYSIGLPEIVQTAKSVDGTERYLMRMADGETVETVWMPGGDGGEHGDGSAAADEERDAPEDVSQTQVSESRPGAPDSLATQTTDGY